MTASPEQSTAPVALVAGASRGLGFLMAGELLRRGHRVAICARGHGQLLEAKRRLSPHGEVRAYACDVSDRRQVQQLVTDVERDLGPVEVLLSVAGVIQGGPAESMSVEDFEVAVGTMLMGPVYLTWAVLPGMRARGHGRIGTITSIGGKLPPPHLLPYAAAKHGAVGFSEALSGELVGTGVTCTTVVPGLMRTGSHELALVTGDSAAEYAWFATAASLPLLSISADRAARRIVRGVLAGKPTVMLTPLTTIGARFHGLAPATTVRLMRVVNGLLPDAPTSGPTGNERGFVAARRLSPVAAGVVRALTVLGSRAAERNNARHGQPDVQA